jgi:threonine dehydrogenase-like Zn-dependent dehydrogenase
MQAVVFLGSGRWAVQEVDEPRLERPDDVLLAVERAGICGTDLHILSDPPGHPATPGTILGHEYVARVVECGRTATALKPGDRVVVDPNIPCGDCEFCRSGRTNLCRKMTTLGIFRNGGLARYSVAPASALHKIAPDVAPERAVLAEPLSCIFAAYEKAPARPGASVVILGAGPIGLAFILLYRKMGAGTIVAVEPRELRRRIASDLGADLVLDFPRDGQPSKIADVLPEGAHIVIDAAGTLLGTALEVVRPGGTVVLFGMVEGTSARVSQYDLTRKELTIVGSFIQTDTFPKVTEALRQKDFPIEKIISHSLPLGRIGEAFESMRKGLALKVILDPTSK